MEEKKRDSIPVCTVHGKFQTTNGRWFVQSEDFDNHVIYTGSQEAELIESPCDECDDPKQIEIQFDDNIHEYSGMMGNNSGEE